MGCLDAVASGLRRNRVNGWHSNRCTNGHSLGLGRPVLRAARDDHNDHNDDHNDDHNSAYDDYFNNFDYFDYFNYFNYDLNYNCTGVALTR